MYKDQMKKKKKTICRRGGGGGDGSMDVFWKYTLQQQSIIYNTDNFIRLMNNCLGANRLNNL